MTESFSVGPFTVGKEVLADIRSSARLLDCPQYVIAYRDTVYWTGRAVDELLHEERQNMIAVVLQNGRVFVRWDGSYK
jgi:hypothetical protein